MASVQVVSAPGDGAPVTPHQLAQHLEQLRHEAQLMQPLIDELYPELFPPKFVSEELTAAGGVAAGMYAAYKLLRIMPLGDVMFTHLRHGMLAATTLYIGWRLTAGCASRIAAAVVTHRRRRRTLLRKWQALGERIERLQAAAQALSAAAPDPGAPGRAEGARRGAAAAPGGAAASGGAAAGGAAAGGAGAAAAPAGAAPATSAGAAPAPAAPLPRQQEGAIEMAALPGASTTGAASDSPGSSIDTEPGARTAPQAPAPTAAPQAPRQSWGSGLAGWSQLYQARPAAAGGGGQGGPGGAEVGPGWPGGSPVMLPKPWDNGGDSEDEEWERPAFAQGGSGGGGSGGGAAGGS
ncbi:MAG: hypothetical protein J3K34DRAFT_527219 [Monoraphidium minutum]|nr:MAG: hypothetical protein J3K34DRAFT_527219 [Monoraphidium minutum]